MKARITFDDEGYIKTFITDWKNGTYNVDDDFDFDFVHCYHLINDKLVLDTDRKLAQEQKTRNVLEISDLKKKLADSDHIFAEELEAITSLSNPVTFISDFIKILVNYADKYKDLIADRKTWRQRIEELEG